MRYILTGIAALITCTAAYSQSTYAPLNKDYYHLLDRYEIRSGRMAGFHTGNKPYERKQIAAFADSLVENEGLELNTRDEFNLQYLLNDNSEWTEYEEERKRPVLRHFYRNKADLFHVDTPDLGLHINPVLHLELGRDSETAYRQYINTRGLELRGMINQKVGFYTFMAENQAVLPGYVNERIRQTNTIPHEGFWKPFKQNGVDFFTARGYITFNATKNIGLQFGHDRQFFGNGYRSIVLSDFANNYLFLKIRTQVWKFQYTNLFAQMTADVFATRGGTLLGGQNYPKKYLAMHHLSLNIGRYFNIGIFENIALGRRDTVGSNSFDINYLNPIIFYRAIEQQHGSPDNVQLGMDFKWNFLRHFSMYGQLLIDEFVLSEVSSRSGWWANKQAGQLGLKYIDALGIPNLDLQAETNIIRPYVYGHQDLYTSYTHYRQPLAHPIGANLMEYIGILRYQPAPRLWITGKAIFTHYGEDTENTNWGTNPLLSYRQLQRTYGNTIGQGVDTRLLFGDLTLSYQLRHNLFVDLKQVVRKKESAIVERNSTTLFTSGGIRWNIPQRLHEF
jgi:hypothetical protein